MPDALRHRLDHRSTVVGRRRIDIDLLGAVRAPTIEQAPVSKALMLAQLSLFSTDAAYDTIRPGQPYLMTRGGAWRRLDLTAYGFAATAYGELSTALSQDGREVALADPSGLVVVDLHDGTFRRFDLPGVHHAVALRWTADRAALLLKDRHPARRPCGPTGCSLDLATGELETVPYDLFLATPGDDGEVVEVTGATRGRPARVVTHRSGAPATEVDLPFRTSPSTAGGPVAARYVAFSQCPPGRRPEDPGGVVVVDSSTGSLVAMLANEGVRGCLGAQAWLSDRHLLVDHWASGRMWLWDTSSGRLRQVASSATTGLHLNVAPEVAAERFGRHRPDRDGATPRDVS